MKYLILLFLVILTGCATGVSTYKYTHLADGSTSVEVKSANEIGTMKMGINRETGILEVEIGDLSKKSDTVEVVNGIRGIIHDVTNPLPDGA